jgi:hypothetical protein
MGAPVAIRPVWNTISPVSQSILADSCVSADLPVGARFAPEAVPSAPMRRAAAKHHGRRSPSPLAWIPFAGGGGCAHVCLRCVATGRNHCSMRLCARTPGRIAAQGSWPQVRGRNRNCRLVRGAREVSVYKHKLMDPNVQVLTNGSGIFQDVMPELKSQTGARFHPAPSCAPRPTYATTLCAEPAVVPRVGWCRVATQCSCAPMVTSGVNTGATSPILEDFRVSMIS